MQLAANGGTVGDDEHEVNVARLKHEKEGRVALLKELEVLRARKVGKSPSPRSRF